MADSTHDSSPVTNLATTEHVTKSVYFASEEFNALRRELFNHWREDPNDDKIGDRSLYYYSGLMVTNPPAFVELMSLELNTSPIFDSGREAEICLEILNALRKKRGVLPLSPTTIIT